MVVVRTVLGQRRTQDDMPPPHMGKTGFGTKVLVMNWNFGYFSKSLR